MLSKQSSTESGPSSSNRLSRQSSSETTAGGNSRNPYQSWHGTPRADANRRPSQHPLPNGPDLNSLPRRTQQRRSLTGASLINSDPASAIPLIEYSLVENGGHHFDPAPERLYSTLERNRAGGPPPRGSKMNVSDNAMTSSNRRYDHNNHMGPQSNHIAPMGNHMDSEAAEAEDYYPDTCNPQIPPGGGNRGGYVKYNSFANY